MKAYRIALIIFLSLFVTQETFAQAIADPTTWSYEVKKKSANEYDLVFHLSLNEGWHLWSLHPGGDGYEIAPSFTFDKADGVRLKDSVTEKGNPVITKMVGIDGKVKYFTGKVDFVQTVVVTGAAKITGEQEYQVCNDKLCLPPKYKKFEFEVR
jgi:hypothetical protein